MTMTLYGVPLSPYVRKIRFLLALKGLDYRLEPVMPFATPDWYAEINPLRRVPALRDGDQVLADSSVIAQYLEETCPGTPAWYGNDPASRARTRWLEKFADYEVAPKATFAVFGQRLLAPLRGGSCDEALVRKAVQEDLPPLFDYLERQLNDEGWLCDRQANAADIALACQLINMEYGGERLDATRWPRLAAHFERVRQSAPMQALLAEEADLVGKMQAKAGLRG